MSEGNKISWPGWETGKLLGRGSFGAVYEIQRSVFDDVEKAALKVISIPQNESDLDEMYSEGYDDESITSTFQNHLKSIVAEYSLMRKMNGCSNIVNCDDVYYVPHDNGFGWDIFIKMELLTPLTKAIPIDVPEEMVVNIAKDMCVALDLCKKHGIVHRDIKPQNIFVSDNGDYKLGDFGIAKTVEKTMGGTKIGTYKYMAPEVYHNQPYGSAADIYSLGLVLYWLLNERRMPFLPLPPTKLKAGMNEEARTRRLSGEKLPPPAHGSAKLKEIILKACAYHTEGRYTSAREMLEDLNALGGFVVPKLLVDEKQGEVSVEKEVLEIMEERELVEPAVQSETIKEPVQVVVKETPEDVVEEVAVQEELVQESAPVTVDLQEEKTADVESNPEAKCIIRFLDIEGNLLARKAYEPGQHVYTPDVHPKKLSGVKHKFLRWEPEFSDVAEKSVDYTAVYQDTRSAELDAKKCRKRILVGTVAAVLAVLLLWGTIGWFRGTLGKPVDYIVVHTEPYKTHYFVGDKVNTEGLTIKVVYEDGSSDIISKGFVCNPKRIQQVRLQRITVTYRGENTSFPITASLGAN